MLGRGLEVPMPIILIGVIGGMLVAGLCRREGIAESLYYNWSKEFLEAGKKRLDVVQGVACAGDGGIGSISPRVFEPARLNPTD
jgi:hypothetical protein